MRLKRSLRTKKGVSKRRTEGWGMFQTPENWKILDLGLLKIKI